VARAAVPRRLIWQVATVKEARPETPTARTLVIDVPDWPGHVAGQHVAVKLTAEDGYSAQRDYSIASAPEPGRLEITVQRLADGEVSPYLTETAEPGDQFEVRGPIGGWFAWHADDPRPLLLMAGGSGIVPLMSMIRAHEKAKSQVPVRLIYSVRTPSDVIYAAEFSERVQDGTLDLTYLYTRSAQAAAPTATPRVRSGRITSAVVAEAAFPPDVTPAIYVCGPSGFVESAASLLVAAGHPPGTIKTERFGPS
jgi:ferredoxin-NADP reductase